MYYVNGRDAIAQTPLSRPAAAAAEAAVRSRRREGRARECDSCTCCPCACGGAVQGSVGGLVKKSSCLVNLGHCTLQWSHFRKHLRQVGTVVSTEYVLVNEREITVIYV